MLGSDTRATGGGFHLPVSASDLGAGSGRVAHP